MDAAVYRQLLEGESLVLNLWWLLVVVVVVLVGKCASRRHHDCHQRGRASCCCGSRVAGAGVGAGAFVDTASMRTER